MRKNHVFEDALFFDDGRILWFDVERASWIVQDEDDHLAAVQEINVANALALAGECRTWVLARTFDAMVEFNVAGSMNKMKAKVEGWDDGEAFLPDEEWRAALVDFESARASFRKIADELIAAAKPLS